MRLHSAKVTRLRGRLDASLRLGLLAVALVASQPALPGDTPSLKDFLGRTQTQTERRAVEDLIQKLQGGPSKPAPAAPGPASTSPPPAASATPPPAAASAPASPNPPATSVTSPKPAPVPPEKAAASAPTVTPQAAVESADKKERPSVDLEIFFEYDEARVTPRAASTLATLGRALADSRLAADAFLIAGHTDAKGGDDYNLALSERRAESVRQFLIDNFKIAPDKLVAKGFGRQHLKNAKQPLAGENRRVQIVNLSK